MSVVCLATAGVARDVKSHVCEPVQRRKRGQVVLLRGTLTPPLSSPPPPMTVECITSGLHLSVF